MSMDVEEQYEKIYRYCYFRLHRRELAEDITQETFLRFYTQENYQETGKALRYLYTIARNLCIDTYKKQPEEPLPEEMEQPDNTETLLTDLTLRAALQQLDMEQQELLLLRYVNEVPMADIGEMFGLSRFAVYRKTNRALKQLRTLLREEDFV